MVDEIQPMSSTRDAIDHFAEFFDLATDLNRGFINKHPVRIHRRKYPRAKIGDTFGPYTVIALLPQVAWRFDERVRVQCTCGIQRDAFVFNLRSPRARKMVDCPHG